MTPHDRAVAWLDAHPGVETTVAERAWNGDRGKLAPKWEELGGQKKSDLAFEVENTLVAFLTSPLPCAICGGELFGDSMSEVGVPGGEIAYAPCAACGGHLPDTAGSGTAGIFLDQLEARYEQVGEMPDGQIAYDTDGRKIEGSSPSTARLNGQWRAQRDDDE